MANKKKISAHAPSGTSLVSSLLKSGKNISKLSASGIKTRSSIVKSAVQGAIKSGKPTKYSKITGIKPMSVPKNVVDPLYKSGMGSFLTGEMRKAKKNFMGPTP